MDIDKTIIGAIGVVIITIVLLALTPTIVAQVQGLLWASLHTNVAGYVNDTYWNFTGASGARSMLGLVPFVWIAAVLLGAVVGMLALFRGRGD
jgi:hypothetical protein